MDVRLKASVIPLLVAFLSSASPSPGKQYTLNVPRVLLPLVPSSGIRSNFTLKSQQGCFTWMSTKPDIVSVEALFEPTERKSSARCSREAVLTPQSTQQSKLSSIIIAEEQATGQTLRCDVFVDTISRVEITTRTRELLLEEEPERFEIQAFDDEGNTFSTIRGHIFEWVLLPDEEATHQQLDPEAILNFVPFEESSYETDPIIGALESRGLQGDTILVAGMSTGTAKVQARLRDRVWKKVRSDMVKLLVVENIMLQPSMDVYLLPLSFVEYHVERRKRGRTEVVMMPSEQYSLELTDTTVGRLDPQRSRVTGLVVGYTEAVLQDKNMTPSATKPTAGIHVVPPHHIGFTIAPGNVWVLEVGREYAITVHVFDKLNHRILITENVLLETVLPSDYLHSHSSSVNGSYHHVRALKPGTASIPASLSKIKHPDTGELHPLPTTVSKQQPLVIYDPVKVEPGRLVMLWDPASELSYQHTLQATGGSGRYQWSCDPEGIVGVSNSGTLTSIARGKTLVIAADKKNPAHFDEAEIFVVPPSEMVFLPSRVEAVTGSALFLPVQVKGFTDESKREAIAFHDCRRLEVNISLTDASIFSVPIEQNADLSSLPAGACTSFKATALKPGHTRITLTYLHKDIFLEATVTIAAYLPLVAADPETVAVVTLGSSKDFVFEGGPAPWVLDRSKYSEKLTTEKPHHVSVYQRATVQVGPTHHVYRVVCRELGEQTLAIAVGNGPTLKNTFPASESAAARLSCALPVSMVIRPVIGHMPDCPLLQSANQNVQFPVRSGQPLDLEVVLYDAESRPFDNFTSLHWQWGSSDENLLPIRKLTALTHHDVGAIMSVQLSKPSGTVVVTATSNRHTPKYLSAEKIDFEDPFSPGVNYSLSLLLRSEPVLSPSSLLVFQHPSINVSLTILHGSGHFRVDHVTKSHPHLPLAKVEYSSDIRQIAVSPLAEGEVKVSVVDLCLQVDREATAIIHIAGIYSVKVDVTDKLQVGSSILALVKVVDSREVPFPSSQHGLMHLQPNPKSSHIEVKPANRDTLASLSEEQTAFSSVFVLHGVTVGTTHLLFNATTPSGKFVSSWPAEIQVFDALKLLPKHITLLPTATFQIRSSGGPMPQTTIAYSIDNPAVATVDDAGLIEAKVPGNATVTGKAQATDPASGQVVTYSEDVVHVRVLKLTGIRMFVPSTRLLAGVEIAIHAYGLEDETPFAFGGASAGVSFLWSASNMDVLSLASVYDRAGVSIQEEQDFAARLRTRNPGQSMVRLTAKCHPGACVPDQATFTDQIQIQVIPPLKLLRPANGHFLLPHNGHTRIVTNRDGISRMSYQLLHTAGVDKQDIVSVSPLGEVQTGAVNGHAIVMVTAHEEDLGLNQTVAAHLEVRPVAILTIVPLSLAQATPNSKQHAFPLGYTAEFIAQLHDSIGRSFDYAEISLGHRLNRFDIVTVSPGGENGTYTVKAAKQGNAILKIWVSTLSHISDYVRIRVGYAILPSLATVHLGSKICFTTHLTEDKPGRWSTGEKGVISIQSETGVATALSTGRAVIYHKIQDVIDTHTEVTVSKVQGIQFNITDTLPIFTNAQRQRELGAYRIPVEFLHAQNGAEFALIQVSPKVACSSEVNSSEGDIYIQQVPFECLLELNDGGSMLNVQKFIKAESYFDPKSGRSFCNLIPIEDHHAVETLSTITKLSLLLRVKASDRTQTYEVHSSHLSTPFIPAFSLSRKSIVLTPSDATVEITVTGLPKQLRSLQVMSPYPISAIQTSSSEFLATYQISLTDYHTPPQENLSNIVVTFTSNLAHQESNLLVSYAVETTPQAACPEVQPEFKKTASLFKEGPTQTPVVNGDSAYPSPEESFFFEANTTYFLAIVVTVIAVCIGCCVICLAVKHSSPKASGGFAAHYPQSPQQAFSPGASPLTASEYQTPHVQRTPLIPGQSGGGSAFKRTGFSPSPQHGLFSQ